MPSKPSTLKLLSLLGTTLLGATLAACGGGSNNDDVVVTNPEEPETPVQAAASECMPSKGMQYKGTYRLSGAGSSTGIRSFIYDQPVTINDQQLLLSLEEWWDLTPEPSDGAWVWTGPLSIERFGRLYAPESGVTAIIHSDWTSAGYSGNPGNVYNRQDRRNFDPLYVDQRFQLLPGQSTEVSVSGEHITPFFPSPYRRPPCKRSACYVPRTGNRDRAGWQFRGLQIHRGVFRDW